MTLQYTLTQIDEVAAALWQSGKDMRVWTFDGDMGAGKTTLIAALCRHIQVEDAVSSPTYALVNEYHYPQNGNSSTLYHMDWYRLSGEEEAIQSGIEDLLHDAEAHLFIEWPERAAGLLPEKIFRVRIHTVSETERMLEAF